MNYELAVVSDVICPWCLIAKENLRKALDLIPREPSLKIAWRPFELNPGMPSEGMDRREYRTRKFGSWEYSQKLDAQTEAAGRLAGVDFRYDLMKRTPNTFDAHRLIWFAEHHGAQGAVVDALFRAYFMEGRDVGNRRELSGIAQQVGFQADVLAFLESPAGTAEVRAQEETAMRNGISGVPTFLLDGAELFSGGLKPELMAARLREAIVADV